MISRYSIVDRKVKREMVLLKGLPCKWGRCSFCDYIHDNAENIDEINQVNLDVLSLVTGSLGRLDVINSGSAFELPELTMNRIQELVVEKDITEIFFESHWLYHKRFDELRSQFNIPVRIRVGVETFDEEFRNVVLKKGMSFSSIEEVAAACDSICLLVGVKGQTKEMVRRDIEILLEKFNYGCINLFVPNSTGMKQDLELLAWFASEYAHLKDHPKIDVLFDNKDLGVFADNGPILV